MPQPARLALRRPNDTLAAYIPKLGSVALDFQPGTLWRYSGLAGFDVLSRVVEIASGKPYDQFLRERLFDPLGMKDTGFALTPAIQPRLVTLYRRGQNGLERLPDQNGLSSATYFSGAGGLVSTAEDYAQFGTMLVNGGELNGKRYLSPRTIELMTSNHTGDMAGGQMGMSPKGIGFGLGVQVVDDPVAADRRVSKGAWGWAGAYGTNVHIEPAADMVQIILMQTSHAGTAARLRERRRAGGREIGPRSAYQGFTERQVARNIAVLEALMKAGVGVLFGLLLVLASSDVQAHHSFAAQYDANKPVTLVGIVTKVEWTNPHARFYVDVKDEKGVVTNWNLELASPNVLRRNGWTRTSLNVGDEVTVEGALAKNGTKMANARVVKLADGRKVFAGSSGGDAPPPSSDAK